MLLNDERTKRWKPRLLTPSIKKKKKKPTLSNQLQN